MAGAQGYVTSAAAAGAAAAAAAAATPPLNSGSKLVSLSSHPLWGYPAVAAGGSEGRYRACGGLSLSPCNAGSPHIRNSSVSSD